MPRSQGHICQVRWNHVKDRFVSVCAHPRKFPGRKHQDIHSICGNQCGCGQGLPCWEEVDGILCSVLLTTSADKMLPVKLSMKSCVGLTISPVRTGASQTCLCMLTESSDCVETVENSSSSSSSSNYKWRLIISYDGTKYAGVFSFLYLVLSLETLNFTYVLGMQYTSDQALGISTEWIESFKDKGLLQVNDNRFCKPMLIVHA